MFLNKLHLHRLFVLVAALLFAACSHQQASDSSSMKKEEMSFFEVHRDGRIYMFYNANAYRSFLKIGETPYAIMKIGEGPKGETLVFSLTKDDKKKSEGIPSIDLYTGKIKANESFYGEMILHDRYYVFSRYQDMVDVRQVGEAAYRYTDIAAGPDGKTVVYVLNKTNKKKKPEALINAFKVFHKL